MIDDKATERWTERAKKLGLIINTRADTPKPKRGPAPKAKAESSKVRKKRGNK